MFLKLKTKVNDQIFQNTKFSIFSKFFKLYEFYKILKMFKIQPTSNTSLNF